MLKIQFININKKKNMKTNFKYISVTTIIWLSLVLFISCTKKRNTYEWEWDKPKDGVPVSEKPRYIWISSGANYSDFANSKENILRDL